MPIFRGKKVKKCPRGYVEDRKTKQCVPINKFKLRGSGGASGLSSGSGGGPVTPVTPVTPVIPVTPVNPVDPVKPQTRDAGGTSNLPLIISSSAAGLVALAALREVMKRRGNLPDTAQYQQIARDEADSIIEDTALDAAEKGEARGAVEEVFEFEMTDVSRKPRQLDSVGMRYRGATPRGRFDETGADPDPPPPRRVETKPKAEADDPIFPDDDIVTRARADADALYKSELDQVPSLQTLQKKSFKTMGERVKTVIDEAPDPQLAEQLAQVNKQLKLENSAKKVYNEADKPVPPADTAAADTADVTLDTTGNILSPSLSPYINDPNIVVDADESTGLLDDQGAGDSSTANDAAAADEEDTLLDQGGAPSDTIDDAELGDGGAPADTVDDAELGDGGAPADTVDDAELGEGGAPADTIDDEDVRPVEEVDDNPYTNIIEEESKVKNPVYDDNAIIRDNIIENNPSNTIIRDNVVEGKPSKFSELTDAGAGETFVEKDIVTGVIDRAAVEAALEPEAVAAPSVGEMILGGLTGGAEEVGGIFGDIVGNVGLDIVAGLGYAAGLVSEGSAFLGAALAGEVGLAELGIAMAGGVGTMMAGMYTMAMTLALPLAGFMAVTMVVDTIFDTNYSGFNPETKPVPRSLELKYTFNKIFESLGIPLVLLGDKYISDGVFGYFEYDGEIYPTSELKTLLPQAMKNNPEMRKRMNFTIEKIYEKTMFHYNQNELQEEFGLDPTTVGQMTFDEIIAMSRPLRTRLVAEISTKLVDLQNEFNDFKKKYDEDNYTSFEDQMDFIQHKIRKQRGGFGIKSNILNGGTGVVATAFGGDVNKLNQVLNRMHYMEEATYGVNGLEVARPYLKPAELVVQGYIDQLIATAKTPDFDTLTPQEQAIVGQPLNIEGLGEGANAIARPDEVVTPVPDSELSKIEPTYGYQPGDPLPEGVTQDNYIVQQGGQPFQFAPESELNPTQSTPSQTTVPVEA